MSFGEVKESVHLRESINTSLSIIGISRINPSPPPPPQKKKPQKKKEN